MRRVIAFLLAIFLVVGLSACGETTPPKKKPQKIVYIDEPVSSEDTSSDENEDSSNVDNSFDNEENLDWESFEDSSPEVVSKITSTSIGSNYFILMPEFFHPGVVGLDAHYKMIAKSRANSVLPAKRMMFECDDPNVKFNKDTIIVPYSAREGGKTLKVTVYDSEHPSRKGSYTFKFRNFSSQPTLEDDFDYFREDIWYYPNSYLYGNFKGEYKDGYNNMTVSYEGQNIGWEQNTHGNFKQAFGCFSTRVKLPDKGLCNASFWLPSAPSDPDDPNAPRIPGSNCPQSPSQTSIEIDVFEYSSQMGASNTSTYHWNGWSSYNKRSGTSNMMLPTAEPLYNDYHIYSVVWTEDTYYTYMDEYLCFHYTGEGVGYGEVMVLLQLVPYYEDHWTGEYKAEFPFTVSWDWVRIWSLDDLDWDKTNKPKS